MNKEKELQLNGSDVFGESIVKEVKESLKVFQGKLDILFPKEDTVSEEDTASEK